jgi:hypothetical protein
MAEESWKDVAAQSPQSWQLPKEGFCEDCQKKVMVKLDIPGQQTCTECGGSKLRKISGDNAAKGDEA